MESGNSALVGDIGSVRSNKQGDVYMHGGYRNAEMGGRSETYTNREQRVRT